MKALSTLLLLGTMALALAAQKIFYYSQEPRGEKTCPPLVPTPTDPSQAAHLTVLEASRQLPWTQKGGAINDASCLDATHVWGIVQVTDAEDIKKALLYAKENGLNVSLAGVRHSMGGQAFAQNALVLDMTKFNQIKLDEKNKLLTVQSGATWHDIQNFLHPRYAVKAMQSTDIFTVGGSISVNAHGMDHQAGSVARTIRAMRIMLPDGSMHTISPTQNPELFRLVVGGYGLFGIILEAEIEVTSNVVYESGRQIIDYTEFPAFFSDTLGTDATLGLFYGHLSTAPQSFLKEMILYTYNETAESQLEIPPLTETGSVKLRRLVINLSKLGPTAARLKWWTEKYLEPKIESCSVSRNQAMKDGEACLVARNEPMHDSVKYLKNNLKGETDILHEYFIPRHNFVSFVDGMRDILTRHNANLLNASVRVVHKEDIALNYAPADAFAIVLYINQQTDAAGHARMQKVTQALIDLTTAHGGRFFLPYQLHYTAQQLQQAYPEITAFFAAKRRYDPTGILTNTWYEKYGRAFAS
ncbi:MAG TPA: FAD-binding oxidoreductase [Candidatus Andersenbacteria bacterium]|nr:FAD-binding oxidoreductase [Candidatus Andersenbacteria bacterium]